MKKIVFLMIVLGMVGIFNSAYGQTYVDLGLPSGTKWKTVNEKGYYTWDKAMQLFGDKMPSKAQMKELTEMCKWVLVYGDDDIQSGYYVVGPNGKRIFLPAARCRNCTERSDCLPYGIYWSSTCVNKDDAYCLYLFEDDGSVYGKSRREGFSVRLVQD